MCPLATATMAAIHSITTASVNAPCNRPPCTMRTAAAAKA